MAGKLLHGARETVASIVGGARHLAWYLSYCVDGSHTRTASPDGVDALREPAAHRRAV